MTDKAAQAIAILKDARKQDAETAVRAAKKVIFAAGPQGDRLQLRLEVACATPQAAADLVKEFSSVTGLLKSMIEREHMTPNTRDLSGVLVAGTFEQRQSTVIGTWPVERGFVEALASGQIQ